MTRGREKGVEEPGEPSWDKGSLRGWQEGDWGNYNQTGSSQAHGCGGSRCNDYLVVALLVVALADRDKGESPLCPFS